tara:strand:- start:145 stop:762 length:618 start_codon:yes stop_codon:yes gene_type:complete
MKNNSFILREEEKERIKKLYEATTASSSGAFNAPLTTDVPVEPVELKTVVVGGDNLEPGSVEINLDIEDVVDMLTVNETKEKERMRKLHKEASLKYHDENSILSEQMSTADMEDNPIEIGPECMKCVENALGKYKDKAEVVATKIVTIGADGEITAEEFGTAITTILGQLSGVSIFDIIPIGEKLYGCVEKCEEIANMVGTQFGK